jgi:hypothetical protein
MAITVLEIPFAHEASSLTLMRSMKDEHCPLTEYQFLANFRTE